MRILARIALGLASFALASVLIGTVLWLLHIPSEGTLVGLTGLALSVGIYLTGRKFLPI